MVEVKVDVLDLKNEGSETIKELADFIKEKTNLEVDTATSEIIVKNEEKNVSRTYLRVILRKFIHKVGLKDYYKVIGGKDNALVIKEKKVAEEED